MTEQTKEKKTPVKIAIVGSAPSSRPFAPHDDPSWQIWTGTPANSEGGAVSRVNAWFELHSLDFLLHPRNQPWTLKYIEFLNKLTCPVYMQEPNQFVPKAISFPKDELVKEFGHNVFTSSAGWMLAKAIYDKVDVIGLFGLDMTAGSEYHYERPGCQYLIAEARKRGIQVIIPLQSDLDVPVPLYGYGDSSHISVKMTEHAFELRQRIAQMGSEIDVLEKQRMQKLLDKAYLSGALEQNINTRRTWHSWSGPDTHTEMLR